VFLGHHLIDPDLRVVGDGLHDLLEQLALEALGLEDPANLGPFQMRHGVDVPVLRSRSLRYRSLSATVDV